MHHFSWTYQRSKVVYETLVNNNVTRFATLQNISCRAVSVGINQAEIISDSKAVHEVHVPEKYVRT